MNNAGQAWIFHVWVWLHIPYNTTLIYSIHDPIHFSQTPEMVNDKPSMMKAKNLTSEYTKEKYIISLRCAKKWKANSKTYNPVLFLAQEKAYQKQCNNVHSGNWSMFSQSLDLKIGHQLAPNKISQTRPPPNLTCNQ